MGRVPRSLLARHPLDVIRLFERDEDAVGNCYLFVCERLCRDTFRRLRRFQEDGPASFPTWLRAVVRNLCLDWHRQEFGRHRVFESVGRLSALDQGIFQAVFVECLPAEEAHLKISPRVPGLTVDLLRDGIRRVDQVLTSRQRWLLSVRRARAGHNLGARAQDDEELLQQTPSEALNPESWTALQEARAALLTGMARLTPRERLLIRLRFERDLTARRNRETAAARERPERGSEDSRGAGEASSRNDLVFTLVAESKRPGPCSQVGKGADRRAGPR